MSARDVQCCWHTAPTDHHLPSSTAQRLHYPVFPSLNVNVDCYNAHVRAAGYASKIYEAVQGESCDNQAITKL